jgi:hypothetical protein
MSIIPPPGQNKRLRNINNILKNYKEPDIPDKMIRKIKKKFPELKDYVYIHPEELDKQVDKEKNKEEPTYIQTVDLNLTNISPIYKCIRVEKGLNNNIKSIILYNEDTKSRFKINPANYYLFRVLSDFEIQINNYTKNIEKIKINKPINK